MTHSKVVCENDPKVEDVKIELGKKFMTLDPESYPVRCISTALSSPFLGNTPGISALGFLLLFIDVILTFSSWHL